MPQLPRPSFSTAPSGSDDAASYANMSSDSSYAYCDAPPNESDVQGAPFQGCAHRTADPRGNSTTTGPLSLTDALSLLGLTTVNVEEAIVRQHWRTKSRDVHPDKNPGRED
ncbi:unnamed protein product, partial [Amoebophrya sp. A25]|eukprot:GSA25T00009862001.1